jgi:hypothetical protein
MHGRRQQQDHCNKIDGYVLHDTRSHLGRKRNALSTPGPGEKVTNEVSKSVQPGSVLPDLGSLRLQAIAVFSDSW